MGIWVLEEILEMEDWNSTSCMNSGADKGPVNCVPLQVQ